MWQKSIIFNYSFHYFNTITYDSFSLLWNIIFQSLFGCRTCKVHVDKYKIYIANIVNTPHWYRQLVFDVTARDQLMAQIEYHQFIVKMIFFVRASAINSIVTIFPSCYSYLWYFSINTRISIALFMFPILTSRTSNFTGKIKSVFTDKSPTQC